MKRIVHATVARLGRWATRQQRQEHAAPDHDVKRPLQQHREEDERQGAGRAQAAFSLGQVQRDQAEERQEEVAENPRVPDADVAGDEAVEVEEQPQHGGGEGREPVLPADQQAADEPGRVEQKDIAERVQADRQPGEREHLRRERRLGDRQEARGVEHLPRGVPRHRMLGDGLLEDGAVHELQRPVLDRHAHLAPIEEGDPVQRAEDEEDGQEGGLAGPGAAAIVRRAKEELADPTQQPLHRDS